MPSNSNWTVEDVRSSHVRYREGDHVAVVPGEILGGGFQQADYALYPNAFTGWERPHQNEPISELKKQEIIERISAALKQRGLKVEVE
jgi:hypothetical protein